MEFIFEPVEIERRSFEIIGGLLDGKSIDGEVIDIVKRVIHTTADFDYADNLVFSPGAVEAALEALTAGARIVTDTQMAKAGVNKRSLGRLGCSVHCYIDSDEVAAEAKDKGVTRASVAVKYAAERLENPLIFAVGNAPTALIALHEQIVEENMRPALIIGAPVGFVNVVEAKELILRTNVPYIAAMGRKGGSNVAAALVNALLNKALERLGK